MPDLNEKKREREKERKKARGKERKHACSVMECAMIALLARFIALVRSFVCSLAYGKELNASILKIQPAEREK